MATIQGNNSFLAPQNQDLMITRKFGIPVLFFKVLTSFIASAKGSFEGMGFVSLTSSTGSSLISGFELLEPAASRFVVVVVLMLSSFSSGVSSFTNTVLVSSVEVAGLASFESFESRKCLVLKLK